MSLVILLPATSTEDIALEVLSTLQPALDTLATATAVAALGAPAQQLTVDAALLALAQSLSDLTQAVGSPVQSTTYTDARAALLDQLALLNDIVTVDPTIVSGP